MRAHDHPDDKPAAAIGRQEPTDATSAPWARNLDARRAQTTAPARRPVTSARARIVVVGQIDVFHVHERKVTALERRARP
jgi:hypothetical protein